MKKLIAALAALIAITASGARAQLITVTNFDDIAFWAGSGENRAALVAQFGDGGSPTSVAWGYRWSGSATAASMLFALAGTITGSGMPSPQAGCDPLLSIDGTYYALYDSYFLNSISYNQSSLPSPWTPSTRLIVNNYFVDGTYPSLYSLAGNGTWSGDPFAVAALGISGLALTNGGWIGFVQSDGSTPYAFSQPVSAVPEPSTFVFIALGATALVGWRWRYA